MTDPMRPVDLTCDEVRDLAGAFVLGALEPAEAAAVRAHLASARTPHAEIAEARLRAAGARCVGAASSRRPR